MAPPAFLPPMLARLVRILSEDPDWEYELKLDGYRLQAIKDTEKVRLLSRRGNDFTRKFAKIATAVSKIKASSVILDGETVVVDNQGKPSFQMLQNLARRHPSLKNQCRASKQKRRRLPHPPAPWQPVDAPPAKPRERRVETKPLGRGGSQHVYLQHLIEQLAIGMNFEVDGEKTIPGGEGSVDVALKKGDKRFASKSLSPGCHARGR